MATDDLISRQGLMNTLHIKEDCQDCEYSNGNFCNLSPDFVNACEAICDAPSAEPRWIPVTERLPEDCEEVNVTWVNHKPESYYESIKDKPFTATAVYYRGKWYWWTTYTQDLIAEYGERCNVGLIHEDIEITAWMPLPQPWKGADDDR